MYFSGWMTDVHHSYWCYSISGLCDILVPPSITWTKWLSLHDNRTGALLLWHRWFLYVCKKSNDQLGIIADNTTSLQSYMKFIVHSKTMHAEIQNFWECNALDNVTLTKCLLSSLTHTPRQIFPWWPQKKNAFDTLFVCTHRLAVWKQILSWGCVF